MAGKGEDQNLTKFLAMLKFQGLWFFPGQPWSVRKLWQVTRVLFIWAFLVLNFISISKFSWQEALVKPYITSVVFTFVSGIFTATFYLKRHTLQTFNQGIQEAVAERPDVLPEFQKVTARSWKHINYVLMTVWIYIVLYGGFPVLVDACLALFTESNQPFVQPMSLESFQPQTRSAYFYFIGILHFVLIANAVSVYGGVLTSLPAFTCYTQFHLRAVVSDIRLWAKDKRKPGRKEQLHRIVQKHHKILGLVAKEKTIIGPCYALHNFISALTIALLLFFAKKALMKGDYLTFAQNIYTGAFQMTSCYIGCEIGETLRSQGAEIEEALYFCGWEEEDPDTRRTLLMIMIAAQKEIIINFKNKFSLKLEFFTELMNSAYSIFMLMDSMN